MTDTLTFATFGCWNESILADTQQQRVIDLLKRNHGLDKYNFLILLGDNYYSKKVKHDVLDLEKFDDAGKPFKKEIKYNDINLIDMKKGFDYLSSNISIPIKMILGNHEIKDGTNQGCSNMRSQLKLPWYDIKFPYDYEDHFLLIKGDYKIIKFIYLDITVYSMKDTTNTCYERVINKTANQIIEEQKEFIRNQLLLLNKDNTNTVVFIGHEPLITFRFKKKSSIGYLSLLDDIYELTKGMHEYFNFHYICADFHNFEEANIIKPYTGGIKDFKIQQLVFGTGGKKDLDERFNPTKDNRSDLINGFKYDMIHRYSSDEPFFCYDTKPLHVNGYGEITIGVDGLGYKFIPLENKQQEWKMKYLKYKNKYIKLLNE